MEELSERQKNILEIVIREHIENASPISSKFIEEKYSLGVSPATIRAELYNLIEKGYLFQPYTSSGRVPTDKGYRFFVDLLTEKEIKKIEKRIEKRMTREVEKMQAEIENRVHFIRQFTRFIAQSSSSLAVSYFPKDNILYKEGWKEVLSDPEFTDIEKIHDFMTLVEDFEEGIDSLYSENERTNCVRIYIGQESPFSKRDDFSVLISPCKISRKKGIFAMMGPKRMAYEKNINLVESIIKLLR